MFRGEVDLESPAEEPPVRVTSEILWRIAVRQFHEHRPVDAGQEPARCTRCGEPWPCSGRRLAELGLNEAVG
jgi:hypothetical protein